MSASSSSPPDGWKPFGDGWKPAIARIEVRDGNGGQAHGTGALVTERLVLTALHVVGNRQVDPPTFYDEAGDVVLRFPTHETRGRVLRYSGSFSPLLDFALVECEAAPPGVRPLPLRDVTASGPDAKWFSFGFPLAAAQTGGGMVVEGNVSDARGEYQGAEALQLYSQQAAAGDGAPVPGLSGGPVIVDGAIVGVMRSSLMADGGRNVAGTLFACPARAIAERCALWLPPLEIFPGLPGIEAGDLPDEPFRYLAWYPEQDAALFFGRNRELAEMYQRLIDADEAPVLLLYGQSGVGKSSFLAAGLLPRLKRTHEARYVRRERDSGLLGSVIRVLGGRDGETLGAAWRRLEQETGRALLVIVDQVEEVYSRPSDREDELGQFLSAAAVLFKERATRPRGRLVLSFRKEWHAEVVTHVKAAEIAQAEVFLRGLDHAAIVEVVRALVDNPRLRKRYGLSLADGLAERIAGDLLADRGSPIAPTLQVLLTKMWKAATAADRRAPRFDESLYEQSKRGDLLREFLRGQLAALERTQAGAVASGLALDVLGYHVTEADTAGQRTLAELKAAYAHTGGAVVELVAELKDTYLLVDSSEDRADHADATRLAHDTLAWHVRRAVDDSPAPGQRARRIVDNRAIEWHAGATGTPLEEADLLRVEAGRAATRALTPDEERLVRASTAARRGRNRRARLLGGVGGLLVALVLAGAVATIQFWRSGREAEQQSKQEQAKARRAATEAHLRATAALAEKQVLTDQTATLTAVTAVGQSGTEIGRVLPPVSRALALAVQQARQVPFIQPKTKDRLVRLAYMGNDVLLGVDGTAIRRWQMSSSAPPKELDALQGHTKQIYALTASPNGELAASGDIGGNVLVWGKDGYRIGAPFRTSADDVVKALAFSADGAFLAVSAVKSGTYLLPLPTGKPELVASATETGDVEAVGVFAEPGTATPESAAKEAQELTIVIGAGDAVSVWKRNGKRWHKQSEGAVWKRKGTRGQGAGQSINAVALGTAVGQARLFTGEQDGTIRVWPLGRQERTVRKWPSARRDPASANMRAKIFSSPDDGGDADVVSPLHVAANRVAVIGGAQRIGIYEPDGSLLEEHRTQRSLSGFGFAPDGKHLAYRDALWLGLIDGTALDIAEPYVLPSAQSELLADPGDASAAADGRFPLAFSRSPTGPRRIAVSDSRGTWVLALQPDYPQNTRKVQTGTGIWVGAGQVKGNDLLVQTEGKCLLATDWSGGTTVVKICSDVANDGPAASATTSLDVQGAIAVRGDSAGGVEVFDLALGKKVGGFQASAPAAEASATKPVGTTAPQAKPDVTAAPGMKPVTLAREAKPAPTVTEKAMPASRGAEKAKPIVTVALAHPGASIVTVLQKGFLRSRDWQGQMLGTYGCTEQDADCLESDTSGNYTLLAQSADGGTLAAAGSDYVHVWSWSGGRGPRLKPNRELGQTGEATALAVSPDGGAVATASRKKITLHDRDGQLFGEIPIGSEPVVSLSFDPSGQILASVDESGTLRLWRVDPNDWLKVACRRLAMSLRWSEANADAKHACDLVRDKPMPGDGIGQQAKE